MRVCCHCRCTCGASLCVILFMYRIYVYCVYIYETIAIFEWLKSFSVLNTPPKRIPSKMWYRLLFIFPSWMLTTTKMLNLLFRSGKVYTFLFFFFPVLLFFPFVCISLPSLSLTPSLSRWVCTIICAWSVWDSFHIQCHCFEHPDGDDSKLSIHKSILKTIHTIFGTKTGGVYL